MQDLTIMFLFRSHFTAQKLRNSEGNKQIQSAVVRIDFLSQNIALYCLIELFHIYLSMNICCVSLFSSYVLRKQRTIVDIFSVFVET